LNPVSFKWIDSTYGRTHYGFIAQEIEQTLNNSNTGDFGGLVIDEMEDGSKLYGLRHHELIAPMVKAIQEQQAIITAQQATLESLTARVVALEGQP
jgi:trimeric autotransporter adhesin